MAVNHSVLIETVDGDQTLSASSPDEQAFVAAAEHFGFDFIARDSDSGVLTVSDKRLGASYDVQVRART